MHYKKNKNVNINKYKQILKKEYLFSVNSAAAEKVWD